MSRRLSRQLSRPRRFMTDYSRLLEAGANTTDAAFTRHVRCRALPTSHASAKCLPPLTPYQSRRPKRRIFRSASSSTAKQSTIYGRSTKIGSTEGTEARKRHTPVVAIQNTTSRLRTDAGPRWQSNAAIRPYVEMAITYLDSIFWIPNRLTIHRVFRFVKEACFAVCYI